MDTIIGLHIRYFDYLGLERFGRICYVELSSIGPETVYVYIDDEEPEFNIHELAAPSGIIKYAEIRTNEEVYLDERK